MRDEIKQSIGIRGIKIDKPQEIPKDQLLQVPRVSNSKLGLRKNSLVDNSLVDNENYEESSSSSYSYQPNSGNGALPKESYGALPKESTIFAGDTYYIRH